MKEKPDTSLDELTKNFIQLLKNSSDGILDLKIVSEALNVPRRRLYDITNVLEGINVLKKKSKNKICWNYSENYFHEDISENANTSLFTRETSFLEEEKLVDENIDMTMKKLRELVENKYLLRYAYLTCSEVKECCDSDVLIAIKAPEETSLEISSPPGNTRLFENKHQIYLKSPNGPINVYLINNENSINNV